MVTIWSLARSSFYAARGRQQHPREAHKRGPKALSDCELIAEIQQLVAEAVFTGEGYRKIWARLRHKGVRTSKDRVLRLLRQNQLLSPTRQPPPVVSNAHEGTILAAAPNQMWGTDATATLTETEGRITIFAAIDHCTAECVGIHAVKRKPVASKRWSRFGKASENTSALLPAARPPGCAYAMTTAAFT